MIKQHKHSRFIFSWGLPKNSPKPLPQKVPAQCTKSQKPGEESVSPRSPDNPWAGLAQSPPEPSHSFSEILRDELQKTDVLTKTANKSLELIQVFYNMLIMINSYLPSIPFFGPRQNAVSNLGLHCLRTGISIKKRTK